MSDHDDHEHEHKKKHKKPRKETSSPALGSSSATPSITPPAPLAASGEKAAQAAPDAGKVIKLNVGGVKFQTTHATLVRVHGAGQPSRFFADLVAGRGGVRDDSGDIFIDRDPTLFAPILEYLRTGRFHAQPALLDAVYKEAVFYGVHLPTGKIFNKENEYHTEIVSVPRTTRPEQIQLVINDKETLGFTFMQALACKSEILLFFRK